METKIRKTCPFQDGFCMFKTCELWTGTMCAIKGIGVILEELLEIMEKKK